MEYEAGEELKLQTQVVIPAHKDYPNLRYDPKDPIKEGDEIAVIFERNGVEEDRLTYVQDTTILHGNEVRAFMKLVLAEMIAFTAPMTKARVTSSAGIVVEKEKL